MAEKDEDKVDLMGDTSSAAPNVAMTPASDEAWAFLLQTLNNLADIVREDARDARERVEGYRVLGRILALCVELSLDVDVDVPRPFPMASVSRQVGGPNPEGAYDVCTITPGRSYRIAGQRESVTYLGFQVMAGTGLAPRRSAAYVSDGDLDVDVDGNFTLVLSVEEPTVEGQWIKLPEDASAIVVRQYVSNHRTERLATYSVQALDAMRPVPTLTDQTCAEQLTALTWTAVKLMTLHRTLLPELKETPNILVTAAPESLGAENTTPDNLYMLGMFDLSDNTQLIIDVTPPPASRYWSITLENVWHECLEPSRRQSSLTNSTATVNDDGTVRFVVAGTDPGVSNWLDTGGRRRGFIVLRWLDHLAAPEASVTVVGAEAVTA